VSRNYTAGSRNKTIRKIFKAKKPEVIPWSTNTGEEQFHVVYEGEHGKFNLKKKKTKLGHQFERFTKL